MVPMSGDHKNNCFAMLLRSRIVKVFLTIGLSFMFTAVYINFFQHPPADMLLAMNSRGASGPNSFGPPRTFGPSGGGGGGNRKSSRNNKNVVGYGESDNTYDSLSKFADGDDEGDDEDNKNVGKNIDKRSNGGAGGGDGNSGVKFADFWEKFLQRNNYVTIGSIYDSCENWQVQYGTVVMLPDKELGGVKARTFCNITIGHVIDGGQFNIEVKYNGKDLYDNYWEICELDEDLPPANRTFDCPVASGHHTKVKDRHIPNYLPKGRYQTKAWASDEDEKVFACGYSDFTI